MTILTLVTLLVVQNVVTMTPGCHPPGCHEDKSCDVTVTQEDVSSIRVDWSLVWWDLDLDCVDTMSVSLNGEQKQICTFQGMGYVGGRATVNRYYCYKISVSISTPFSRVSSFQQT